MKKTYWVPNDINKASDSAFTVNVQCVYHRLRHKPSVALETHVACARYSVLMKKRAEVILDVYLSIEAYPVVLIITKNY